MSVLYFDKQVPQNQLSPFTSNMDKVTIRVARAIIFIGSHRLIRFMPSLSPYSLKKRIEQRVIGASSLISDSILLVYLRSAAIPAP